MDLPPQVCVLNEELGRKYKSFEVNFSDTLNINLTLNLSYMHKYKIYDFRVGRIPSLTNFSTTNHLPISPYCNSKNMQPWHTSKETPDRRHFNLFLFVKFHIMIQ